ncbi:COMM domain-containing protein 8-like [Haliotis rubra]|uniref:COMM domain-containing protein 8-like n=1 Tax=Haliotis rubra TaxID=36100 RepID=UPI001EE54CCB|nr:COMM domain-containing protein 8-like [Haliotis rubra]
MADTTRVDVITLFTKCSLGELNALCHTIAGNITSRQPLDYNAYSKLWSLEEWWNVTESIHSLLKLSIKNPWTKDEIFEKLGTLPDDYKQTFMEVVSVRREDLRKSLLASTAAISQNVMADFDWQMKLVMSSDKLSSLHSPLLNLDLQVADCNNQNRVVSLELDRTDLKKLIASLEGAGKAVQQLSS